MSSREQENPDRGEFEEQPSSPAPDWNRWWLMAVLMLFAATGASMIYAIRQHSAAQGLARANDQIAVSLRHTQAQVASLTDQVTALKAQAYSQPPAAPGSIATTAVALPAASETAPARSETLHRRIARRFQHHSTPSHYAVLRRQLSQQQQQINAAQQAIAQTRSDLENSLSSTRDDLNTSIAHNHAELVALERKGERSYYEFSIPKSKQFQREGPISLSLRHASTKHKNYNLVVFVDDMQLSKKNVNLYEPLVFQTGNDAPALQVVVNRIEKNRIQGYVSAAKYSALRASASIASGSVAAGPPAGVSNGMGSAPPTSSDGPSLERRPGTD